MSQTQLSVEDYMDILPPDYREYRITSNSFDERIIRIYNALKERFPGVYVNFKDGRRVHNWCGYRTPPCSVGAPGSAHKTGRALDLHHDARLEELRDYCESFKGRGLGILRVENREATKGWVHIDVMPPNEANWKDRSKPYVFKP